MSFQTSYKRWPTPSAAKDLAAGSPPRWPGKRGGKIQPEQHGLRVSDVCVFWCLFWCLFVGVFHPLAGSSLHEAKLGMLASSKPERKLGMLALSILCQTRSLYILNAQLSLIHCHGFGSLGGADLLGNDDRSPAFNCRWIRISKMPATPRRRPPSMKIGTAKAVDMRGKKTHGTKMGK